MRKMRRCRTKQILNSAFPSLASASAYNCSPSSWWQGREKARNGNTAKARCENRDSLLSLCSPTSENLAGVEFAWRQAHPTAARFQAGRHHGKLRYAAIENRPRKCSVCNSIRKSSTRHAERKFSPILSITFAVVAGTGRCAITSSGPCQAIRATSRRRKGDSRLERRRGFKRGGGVASQGHWQTTDLYFREQRPAPRA